MRKSVTDPQLEAVRKAIKSFMEEFDNLRIQRHPELRMLVDKNDETLNILQLSQGEKCLMALVGDIARRLAMMNPEAQDPLLGNGIILIDEIDLHLHPTWQRGIIARLKRTFSNCQFILTTHSPLVISDCKDILLYSLDDGELSKVNSQYGQDVNTVLLEVMDTDIRNTEVEEKLDLLFSHIQENDFESAKNSFEELEQELTPDNIELAKAQLLLRKQELRYAKDK